MMCMFLKFILYLDLYDSFSLCAVYVPQVYFVPI